MTGLPMMMAATAASSSVSSSPFADAATLPRGRAQGADAATAAAAAPAIPAEIQRALELIDAWRASHSDAPKADDDSDSSASSDLDRAPPVRKTRGKLPSKETVHSYSTVSIKSAQIDHIAKLNVGKATDQLTWWFDITG